jgi:hypothetical protein
MSLSKVDKDSCPDCGAAKATPRYWGHALQCPRYWEGGYPPESLAFRRGDSSRRSAYVVTGFPRMHTP